MREISKEVIGFLGGKVMQATQGKANPKMVNEILKRSWVHNSSIHSLPCLNLYCENSHSL